MSAILSSLGVLRILLGHPISYYIIGGYVIVVAVTFFAPVEIIGLAYDSGGVTTSTVTMPLVAALGIGLSYLFRTDTNDGYMICNSSACFGHEKDMNGVKEVLKRRKGESNDD